MARMKDILENFSEKFPILNKTYELYQSATGISSSEENTLRKSAEITILEILELIVIATRQARVEKKHTLKQALRKLDTMKVFADMAAQLELVKEPKYNEINEGLKSVGAMLGGWLKSVSVETPAAAAK
ncbi:MAG: four helix bundle protein [Patescibacteria group bacterium]|nr:four helix bundle protein [Patescibacteria group bacterium]